MKRIDALEPAVPGDVPGDGLYKILRTAFLPSPRFIIDAISHLSGEGILYLSLYRRTVYFTFASGWVNPFLYAQGDDFEAVNIETPGEKNEATPETPVE